MKAPRAMLELHRHAFPGHLAQPRLVPAVSGEWRVHSTDCCVDGALISLYSMNEA